MEALAWLGVEHPLDLALLLGLHDCWRCRSLVVVEKEVVDVHLDALPHFLHLGVSHLWMLPYQLLVHLVVR